MREKEARLEVGCQMGSRCPGLDEHSFIGLSRPQVLKVRRGARFRRHHIA